MTNEFNVIGQHKDDDLHLLVLGDDGQHYDYAVANDHFLPIEVDDAWLVDHDVIDGSIYLPAATDVS